MSNHCYCGHSEIMPYCDGTHAKIGQATPGQRPSPEAAPPAPTPELPAATVDGKMPDGEASDRENALTKFFGLLKIWR
jgi:hypothetical protein